MQKGWLKKKSNKEEGIKAAFKEGLILMGFLGLGGGIKASLWTKLRVRLRIQHHTIKNRK